MAAFASAPAAVNLFSNGRPGPLLGSHFGLPQNASYDYVVVGGGTAGLAVASRLAENGSFSVAVVEAGGFYEIDNGNLSVIPGEATYYSGMSQADFQPLIDWGIGTVPQPQLGGRILHYARGKTLGGSSARNYMVYHRPSNGSLQKWADEVGDQGFAPGNMFPWYKKSVNVTDNSYIYTNISNPQDPAAFEPRSGPLQLSFGNYFDAWASWSAKALGGIGMPLLAGLTSGSLLGYGFTVSTIDIQDGQRQSSESGFLQTAIQSGRAPTVYKNTLTEKIVFDANKTASSVNCFVAGTFGTPGLSFTLSARKEIIISAGAFQSPQLLMVSGVGNRTELAQQDISSVADLPGVGQNMWDHAMFGTIHAMNIPTGSAALNNASLARAQIEQYIESGTGPLSAFGIDAYGWEKLPEPYRSNLTNATLAALNGPSFITPDWPEIEWLPAGTYGGYFLDSQTASPVDGMNYAEFRTALVAPLSRGTVKLSSASMRDLPLIDPAWFRHPADKELAIAAFRRQRQAWDVLIDAGIAHPDEALPGLNVTTDDQIWHYAQKSISTVWHAASTCKMGRANDTMAVVDSRARVFGVQRLRVVDASTFPFLPPGHPQSTVYALAEKIADDILNS